MSINPYAPPSASHSKARGALSWETWQVLLLSGLFLLPAVALLVMMAVAALGVLYAFLCLLFG